VHSPRDWRRVASRIECVRRFFDPFRRNRAMGRPRQSSWRRSRPLVTAVVVLAQVIATTGAPLPTPPRDAALATATSHSPAPLSSLCSGGSSCCCATSGGTTCGCCCSAPVATTSPKASTNEREAEFRWVGGILTAKCRGDGPAGIWKAELVAVPSPLPAVPKSPQPPRFAFPRDWYATSFTHRPPTPPPRLS
jgi:hypothetical protein